MKDYVKLVKYKNNTIKIVRDHRSLYDIQHFNKIGVIAIHKKLECLAHNLGGVIEFMSDSALEIVKNNKKFVSIPVYCKKLKNSIRLKIEEKEGYEECGLNYMFKDYFDKIEKLPLYKKFKSESRTKELNINLKKNLLKSFEKYYWAEVLLQNDIKRINDYLMGHFYGYKILGKNKDLGKMVVTNSCYGYLTRDIDSLIEEAKEIVDKLNP